MAENWTPLSAWKYLTERPLTFGDDRQISAHKFLLSLLEKQEEELGYPVEFAADALEGSTCENCHGSGYCECSKCGNEHDCKECYGTGYGMPKVIQVAA